MPWPTNKFARAKMFSDFIFNKRNIMKITLLKSVLLSMSNVTATKAGTTVELPDDEAKDLITAGLAEAASGKTLDKTGDQTAPKPANVGGSGGPTLAPLAPRLVDSGKPGAVFEAAPGTPPANRS